MPEVEDVAGAITGTAQDIMHASLNGLPGCQQQRGVEVALDATVIADPCPCIVKVDAPIDTDYVTTSLGHQLYAPRPFPP